MVINKGNTAWCNKFLRFLRVRFLERFLKHLSHADDEALVVPGRNNPSLYTVNGRPLYVHLNGLAIV